MDGGHDKIGQGLCDRKNTQVASFLLVSEKRSGNDP